jgi:hypothetical protein
MNTKLDPKTVDRAMDQVTVILDAMSVDMEPPTWDLSEAIDTKAAYDLVSSLDMAQQVAFLRHCAIRIRSSIIRREVEQEIADERKALGDDFYRPRVTA